ncbi:hypothetical protein ACFX2G_044811 [Malus domestica]
MSWKTLKHPGSRRIKKALFVLRSSFILRSSPDGPLDQQSSTFKPKPQRPLEESVHRSSFINCSSRSSPKALEDPFKPKSSRRSVHHCSSRSSPKALKDPSITILQDQAQKPLKIRSSSFIQDQASTALGSIAHPINQHLTEIESEDQNRERL